MDRLTVRAALFHAVFVGSVTAIKSATNALYLANRPPEGLAQLYVAVAVMVGLATAALAGPLAGRSPLSLLRATAWLFAGLLAVLAGLSALGVSQVLGVLYVTGELFGTCLSILFWSAVSGWFDARTSRRAFGFISAGGMAGAILGGGAMRGLVIAVTPTGVAPLMGGLTLAALALLRGLPEATPSPRQREGGGLLRGASYLWGHPFPRAIALLAAIYAALGACVDYVFRVASAVRLTEHQLATLFGDLNAAVGVASIAYQLLLTRKVLDRGGLFLFLSVIPALLAVNALGAAALPSWFSLVVLMKGLEMAGSYSIQQSGMQLLYNPVPPQARAAVRAFGEGLVKKGGVALAGVGLALLVGVAPAGASPLLVTLLAGACLWVIRRARDSYVVALEEKLRISPRTTHVGVPSELEVADKVTLDSLVRALHSQDGTQVRTALSILRRSSRFRLEEHLQSLLTHEDEAVRMMALDLVPAHPSPEVEFVLASILSLDRRRPRAAAARALARCQPHRAGQVLGPYLHDPDPGVACAVIAALFPLEDCRAAARARLEDLLAQRALADAMLRRELARLLGDLPPLEALPVLPALVGDDESSVRALALRSAGALCARAAQEGAVDVALAVVPFLEQRLAVRSDRGAARSALAQLGDHVVPLLRQNLDDRTLPLGVRIEIPRILRAIGTRAAGQAMLFSNVRDHPSLRWRTAESIFQLRRQHPDVELDLGRANQACLRRLAGFSHYRPLCHALALADETAPKGGQARRAWDVLRHATTDRLLQNLEMAVRLLGLHRGVERMDRVAEQLVVAERAALDGIPYAQVASGRADALEVLDVALRGDDLHSDVMRVLEPPPPIATAEGPANLPWRTVADTARALRCSADPLVAALAHRVLRSGLLMPDEASIPKEMPPPPSPDDGALVSDPTDHAELDMDDALVTKILALEKVDLFSGLPVDDVAAIASIAVERHAEAGEVLYREGDPGETMMVLISGTVSLSRAGRAYMKMGPGESIGQVSLLDRGPRPTTAVVSDPLGAELLTIGCDAFIDLVTDRPELMRGLFGVLAKRLRALIDMQAGRVEA